MIKQDPELPTIKEEVKEDILDSDSDSGIQIYDTILTDPNKLHRHISIKLEVLKKRDDIIQLKLTKNSKHNEHMNICIIVI